MAISARKSIDQTSLELKKQESVGRMLVQATVLYPPNRIYRQS